MGSPGVPVEDYYTQAKLSARRSIRVPKHHSGKKLFQKLAKKEPFVLWPKQKTPYIYIYTLIYLFLYLLIIMYVHIYDISRLM